jgi:DNA-binding protein HU-beta
LKARVSSRPLERPCVILVQRIEDTPDTYGSNEAYGVWSSVVRARRLNLVLSTHGWENSMPLTQSQLAAAVAEYSGLSRAQAKAAIDALEEVVLTEIGNAEKVKIGNLVQLTVRVKPPTKAREGRNPATGETIKIAAKPASVDVRARVLAKTKAALPSLQKARRRLAA